MSTTALLVCALPTKLELKAPHLVSENYVAQLLNRPSKEVHRKKFSIVNNINGANF